MKYFFDKKYSTYSLLSKCIIIGCLFSIDTDLIAQFNPNGSITEYHYSKKSVFHIPVKKWSMNGSGVNITREKSSDLVRNEVNSIEVFSKVSRNDRNMTKHYFSKSFDNLNTKIFNSVNNCVTSNNMDDLCDFDGDGIINFDDLDDDNDGVLDDVENENCHVPPAFQNNNHVYSVGTCSPDELPTDGVAMARITATNVRPPVPANETWWGVEGDCESVFVDFNHLSVGQGYSWCFLESNLGDIANQDAARLVIKSSDNSIPDSIILDVLEYKDDNKWLRNCVHFIAQSSSVSIEVSARDENGLFTSPQGNDSGPYIGVTHGDLAIVPCHNEDDTDNDGIPNRFDLDSDGDGCSDAVEAGFASVTDNDTTNIPTGVDTIGIHNGLLDIYETPLFPGHINYLSTYNQYAKTSKISLCRDTDGDGVLDVDDLDDDNDGIRDFEECGAVNFTFPPGYVGQNFWTLGETGSSLALLEFNTDDPTQLPRASQWNGLSSNYDPTYFGKVDYYMYLFDHDGNWTAMVTEDNIVTPDGGIIIDNLGGSSRTNPILLIPIPGQDPHLDFYLINSSNANAKGYRELHFKVGADGFFELASSTNLRILTDVGANAVDGAGAIAKTDGSGEYWMVVPLTSGLIVYDVTANGIETPPIHSYGATHATTTNSRNGNDEFSRDGKYFSAQGQLYDFNTLDGTVGEPMILHEFLEASTIQGYNCLFSTEDNILYLSGNPSATQMANGFVPGVFAFDLNEDPGPTSGLSPQDRSALILASAKQVFEMPAGSELYSIAIQQAPDGRYYVSDDEIEGVHYFKYSGRDVGGNMQHPVNERGTIDLSAFMRTNSKGLPHNTIKRATQRCDLDTDGDGITNDLDLDSDGDGCSDAFESSVTLANTETNFQFDGSNVGSNGFENSLETGPESGEFIGNYTYKNAIDANVGSNCPVDCTLPANITHDRCDFDGDGIPNGDDLDDDNDGILDTLECPGYFPVSNLGYPVCNMGSDIGSYLLKATGQLASWSINDNNCISTGLTSVLGNNQFSSVVIDDPQSGEQELEILFGSGWQNGSGADLVIFGSPSYDNADIRLVLGDNTVSDYLLDGLTDTNSNPNSNICNGNTGSGCNIVNCNGNINNTSGCWRYVASFDFAQFNIKQSDVVVGVRIRAAQGSVSLRVGGIGIINNAVEVNLANGIPSICDDDGDGILNQFDLDSDGDGCSDLEESGVTADVMAGNVINGSPNDSIAVDSATVVGPYGANGLANSIESDDGANASVTYTSVYLQFALDSTMLRCETPPDIVTDTVVIIPSCPTCAVKACAVNEVDTAGANVSFCTNPGYTLSGPDTSGCYFYTPNGNVKDTTQTCIITCNGNYCDTTVMIIAPPIPSPDTIITKPACDTCTVNVCGVNDDVDTTGASVALCSGLVGYTSTSTGTTACFDFKPTTTPKDTVETCIVTCKNQRCDTTIVIIAPPDPTPDTMFVTPSCDTCMVNVCAVNDDIDTTGATVTQCIGLTNYTSTASGNIACFDYKPSGSVEDTVETCIITCNKGRCDTTVVILNPPPPSPDTLMVKPLCVTCSVNVCGVNDDVNTTGATVTQCTGLTDYTSTASGNIACFDYKPSGSVKDTVETCIVTCKNQRCDTTIVIIAPADPTPDTLRVKPICDTCTVTVCPVNDDVDPNGATVDFCSDPTGYTRMGPDQNGCYGYKPDGNVIDTLETCIITCNKGRCDTTVVILNPPPPSPDTLRVKPICDTCAVTVCPVNDDVDPNGATVDFCVDPMNYSRSGSNQMGCFTYKPNGSVKDTATTCIVTCKNGRCDTTVVVLTPPNPSLDSIVVVPSCDTCPITVCGLSDDVDTSGATIDFCPDPPGYTRIGPDANGCYSYTPDGSVKDTFETCIIVCKNNRCDSLKIILPPPLPGPDSIIAITSCDTCGVSVCPVNDDVDTVGSTVDFCPDPTGYIKTGPDMNGCYNYKPNGSVKDSVETCIITCKNGRCDSTIVILPPPPPSSDSVTVKPACDTCSVTVCPINDDIDPIGAIDHFCAALNGYTRMGPDANGCYIYKPNNVMDTVKTCIITCKDQRCDVTEILLLPPDRTESDTILVTQSCDTCDVMTCGTYDEIIKIGATFSSYMPPQEYQTIGPDANGCVTYRPDSIPKARQTTYLIGCNNGLCDTTYVMITPFVLTTDFDNDGILDFEDLDDDNDGILDVNEMSGPFTDLDTDGDGQPDRLDLDSDNDGINDIDETNGIDVNKDGMADGVIDPKNGIPSSAVSNGQLGNTPIDSDNDSVPDFLDLDSDDDSISDLIEGNSGGIDADHNGVIDGVDSDNDGIMDSVDGEINTIGDKNNPALPDRDGEGTPDYRDVDSDDPMQNIPGSGDGICDDIVDIGNAFFDANLNGMVDDSIDMDRDGILDLVDFTQDRFGGVAIRDTDNDGIFDYEDLDDDNDGITDERELSTARNGCDTDGDGIPDHLDLDSDNDGINDVDEANGTDIDRNGMVDGPVNNQTGIPLSSGNGVMPVDTDIDGIADFQDLDSDNDSISDLKEAGSGATDTNNDGLVDGPDSDMDGIKDDMDGNISNRGDSSGLMPIDTDGEGTPDYRDVDSDDPNENLVGGGNGVNDDIDENGNSNMDANDDGKVDSPVDADGDGIPDTVDTNSGMFGGFNSDGCSDLSPVITIVPNTVINKSEIEVRIAVSELNDVSTDSIITVIIPYDKRLEFEYDSTLTKVANLNVQNLDWKYVGHNGVVHFFQYNGMSMAGGSVSSFGIMATYDPENTLGATSITSTIMQNSGGECQSNNNTDAERVIYFSSN